jgi:hypothetical protein
VIDLTGENSKLLIKDTENEYSQRFDKAFGSASTQIDVFTPVKEALQQVMQGINLTVFAYG